MDPKDRETKQYDRDDAASLALAGAIAALATRLEEVVTIQAQLAEDLAEHSRKSAEAQAMLLGEIERAKTEHLLRTGDQGKAIEILKIERESMDNELRQELEYHKRELDSYRKEQPALLRRLEKISERLERGGKEIDKGVMAWRVLVWAAGAIGLLLLTAAFVKIFGAPGQPVHLGQISFGTGMIWSAWLGLSGLLAGAVHVVLAIRHHFGG